VRVDLDYTSVSPKRFSTPLNYIPPPQKIIIIMKNAIKLIRLYKSIILYSIILVGIFA